MKKSYKKVENLTFFLKKVIKKLFYNFFSFARPCFDLGVFFLKKVKKVKF